MLGLGLAVRLLDLTDPPLDFNPTRQLLGAIVARGMYYQMLPSADLVERDQALSFSSSIEEYEPLIFNRLVALTYLLAGGEHLWIARVYAILFWLLGGVALYALASRMISARSALIGLGFYLFLPFAIVASRSFQVDPLMVMMILVSAYALYRWAEEPSWEWAVAAGVLSGLTILVKVTAGFPVIGMAAGVILSRYGIRKHLINPQVGSMLGLMALPAILYYLVGLSGRSSDYFAFWTLSMWRLVLDPSFFVRWMSFVHHLVDLSLLFITLVGVLIAPRPGRPLLLGMWAGYLVYGMFFPFQIRTHDYYHLMLVAIMGLSLAPVAEAVLARLDNQERLWQVVLLGLAVVAIAYPVWVGRSQLLANSYHHEPPIWREIGAAIPQEGDLIALTHDYGYRLMYYGWRKVSDLWPAGGDLELAALRGNTKSGEAYFSERIQGKRYFLVTLQGELERQAWLQELLYSNYAVLTQGDGYVIFDLERAPEEGP